MKLIRQMMARKAVAADHAGLKKCLSVWDLTLPDAGAIIGTAIWREVN